MPSIRVICNIRHPLHTICKGASTLSLPLIVHTKLNIEYCDVSQTKIENLWNIPNFMRMIYYNARMSLLASRVADSRLGGIIYWKAARYKGNFTAPLSRE